MKVTPRLQPLTEHKVGLQLCLPSCRRPGMLCRMPSSFSWKSSSSMFPLKAMKMVESSFWLQALGGVSRWPPPSSPSSSSTPESRSASGWPLNSSVCRRLGLCAIAVSRRKVAVVFTHFGPTGKIRSQCQTAVLHIIGCTVGSLCHTSARISCFFTFLRPNIAM